MPATSYLPAPPAAYHRMLVSARPPWWRLAVSLVAVVPSLVVMSLVGALAILGSATLLGRDASFDLTDGVNAGELLATNLGLALQIPVAFGLAYLLYSASPRRLSSVQPGLRWSWLVICIGISAVIWSPFLVLGTAGAYLYREAPVDAAVLGFLVVVLLTTPLQAAGEEYLFRGLILQGLGAARLPTWVCCLVSGVLFAAAHLQFEPALFADRLFLGIMLAWLAIRTGGLEAGIAIHAIKNLAVLAPAGLLDNVQDALDPTNVSWVPLVVDVVLVSLAFWWMTALSSRRNAPSPSHHR